MKSRQYYKKTIKSLKPQTGDIISLLNNLSLTFK